METCLHLGLLLVQSLQGQFCCVAEEQYVPAYDHEQVWCFCDAVLVVVVAVGGDVGENSHSCAAADVPAVVAMAVAVDVVAVWVDVGDWIGILMVPVGEAG